MIKTKVKLNDDTETGKPHTKQTQLGLMLTEKLQKVHI